MNTYLYMDNYRGFSDTTVPLAGVNFLVGENSTGKTSFLELLETFFSPPFWIFEPRFSEGEALKRHFLDLVSVSSARRDKFTIGVIVFEPTIVNCSATLITYKNVDGRPRISSFSRIRGQQVKSIRLRQSQGEDASFKVFSKSENINDVDAYTSSDLFVKSCVIHHSTDKGMKHFDIPENVRGAPLLFMCSKILSLTGEESSKQVSIDIPSTFGKRFVSLAPIRTKPRRTYDRPQTAFSPEGGHTPYVIRKKLSSKNEVNHFKEFIDRAGQESGLFDSVRIREYGRGSAAPFELDIVLGKNALSIDNVGYGVSQSLPVFVEMFVRSKDTVFSIQQPEVHLHPRAQATIGGLIAELARLEGKNFFVETHSDFTIDRFRLNIRKYGKLPVDSQLLFFERANGGNKVTSIGIDENGDISESQPAGYRAFFMSEQLDILS
ncbi:MAG: AAA family ATPase [Candidatus Accumulibacter phosphatis]|uniref:AAA family ATPase n=1 Tax=Candidatus Accumulibacter phosphatis TaxID=327160 RepID=UPI001A551F94|nr:AAA family ATPase [Candidatus Accumulibacter phosphatis]